ncbi:BadF/BadG/BcrA/BcrD ATPase family protein [Paenibacillus flagellatus]|uniref:BadF/BadG/BcrA/BcrD ATPase family protein n=1 Tax=Paenibacillus flagellatus TaxID=2211139 RepID=UPI0013053900|nr:BadF/BadG/BcrA/BcrD ATPase family protein [Paenibacillus flagellatus]
MRYVIGIDGGGTKTEALVLAEDGREWGGLVVDSTNPFAVSFEQATRNMASLLDKAFSIPELREATCEAVCLGLAGVDTDDERARFRSFVEQYRDERGLVFETFMNNDAQIALMATLGDDRGIIVISGTGSIAFGLTEDRRKFRVGGWGPLLGDEGSGYDIGVRTLKAAMRSHDGIEPATLLTESIVRTYGFASVTDLRTYIYQPHLKKHDIAKFAELCIRADEQGDDTAGRILDAAAGDLAASAAALVRKDPWFEQCRLVTTGSIFRHSTRFADAFRTGLGRLAPNVRVIPSEREPAYGAALLARRQLRQSQSKGPSS